FQGRVFAPRQGGHWNTQISGELTAIDLDLLVSEQFPPHKLTGTANASVDFITDSNGRILSAGGRATAGPGVISVSLVRSAGTHLSLPAVEMRASNDDHLIPYKNLGLAFAIDTRGLRLRGEMPEAPGALLVDSRERPLVAEPRMTSQ